MSEKVVIDRFIEYSKTRSIGSILFFLLRDVKGKYILRYFDTRQMGSTIHSFSCLEVLGSVENTKRNAPRCFFSVASPEGELC